MSYILGVTLSVGISCFLLWYILKDLDEKKHFLIKMLGFTFIMTLILLVLPKVALDSQTVCEPVIANTTEAVAGEVQYSYERFCYTRPETTGKTVFGLSNTMYYLVLGYWIVFLAIAAMMKLVESAKTRRGER